MTGPAKPSGFLSTGVGQDRSADDAGMVKIPAGMFAETVKAVEKTKEGEKIRTSFKEVPTFSRWFNTNDATDLADLASIYGLTHTSDPWSMTVIRPVGGKTETWDSETSRSRLFLVWSVFVEVAPGEVGRLTRDALIDRYRARLPGGAADWVDRSR